MYTGYLRACLCISLFIIGSMVFDQTTLGTAGTSPSRFGKPDLTIYSADVDPLKIGPGVMTYPDDYDPVEYRDQVTTMEFSDDIPNEGEVIMINLTVFNIGLQTGSGTVRFYDGPILSGTLIGSDNVSVDPFNYDIASAVWDTSGIMNEDHEIFAYVTPEGNETNEENNAGSEGILINFYPVASFIWSTSDGHEPPEGTVVIFDPSASSDTERDMKAGLDYRWEILDPLDPTFFTLSDPSEVTHRFQDMGSYRVNLTVIDQHGASTHTFRYIEVRNLVPVPSIILEGGPFVEDEEVFIRSEVVDSDHDLDLMEYRWDMGDGLISEWSTDPNVVHSYSGSGEYLVVLSVRDDDGGEGEARMNIEIHNLAPIVKFEQIMVRGGSIDPTSIYIEAVEDDPIHLEVHATDTVSDDGKLEHSWYIDNRIVGDAESIDLSFPGRGERSLKVVVDDGDAIGTANLKIGVSNLAPIADAGPDQVLGTDRCILNGSRSIDTPSDQRNLTYVWDLGDGKIREGMVIEHTFGDRGKFTVVLQVTDDDGESSMDSMIVDVRNSAPRLSLDFPPRVMEDETFVMDASASVDPDGKITTVRWLFEDGQVQEGRIIEHTFYRSGIRTVEISAFDDSHAMSSIMIRIEVMNMDPVAEAGPDNETLLGWTVVLDGSSSNDTPSDRRNLTYIWDIHGVGSFHNRSLELRIDVPGTVEVLLTVIDDDGARSMDALLLRIKNITLLDVIMEIRLERSSCNVGSPVMVSGMVRYDFMESQGALDPSLVTVTLTVDDLTYWIFPSSDGTFHMEIGAPHKPGRYMVVARTGRFGIIGEASAVLDVREEGPQLVHIVRSPVVIATGATVVLLMASAGAALSTDIGRWRIFLLMVPLFSRLSRDRVLENFERGRIYQYIVMNPGDHFSHIRAMLEMNIGTITYHLSVLEREEFIRSVTDGRFKRFYPRTMRIEGGTPNDVQEMILALLVENPGMSQKEMARAIGIHVSTVNYHVNLMVGAGIIRPTKRGPIQRYEVRYDQGVVVADV